VQRRQHESIDGDSDEGRAYLARLRWLRSWAHHNRRANLTMAAFATEAQFGGVPDWDRLIDTDHNHVAIHDLDGDEVFVHRKGTVDASPGTVGVIPGSMGTPTFHVAGRSHAGALWSSSHGAGRHCSRAEARRRFSPRELRRQLGATVVSPRKLDRLRDEAPGAYKDITAVMRAQRDLVRIVRRLHPVVTHKGT
jgi:tRNA-splicing ligase RtcB